MEVTGFMKQARSMTVKKMDDMAPPPQMSSICDSLFLSYNSVSMRIISTKNRNKNNLICFLWLIHSSNSFWINVWVTLIEVYQCQKSLPVWFHVYVWLKSSRAWDVYVKTAAVLSNCRTWMCLWILGWLCSFLLRNNIFSTVLSCTGFSFLVMTFLHLDKTISNDAEELCSIIQNNCVGLDICTSTYPGVAVTHLLGTQQILYLGIKIKEEKKNLWILYK